MADDRQPQKPSYFKAAFANVYNLSLLGGVTVAALATNEPWLLAVGALLEGMWLLFATDSKRLRRAVDARHAEELRALALRRLYEESLVLPAQERSRVHQIGTTVGDLKAEAKRNRFISGDFMQNQLDRLDDLVTEFVHLSVTAFRARAYLAKLDVKRLDREREQHRQTSESSQDLDARDLARQNMELLEKRLGVVDDLNRFLGRASGQLSLIENTVGLLRDQIMTMSTPEALTTQLDSLVASVDAIREATKEAEALVGIPSLALPSEESPPRDGVIEAAREAGAPAADSPLDEPVRGRSRERSR